MSASEDVLRQAVAERELELMTLRTELASLREGDREFRFYGDPVEGWDESVRDYPVRYERMAFVAG